MSVIRQGLNQEQKGTSPSMFERQKRLKTGELNAKLILLIPLLTWTEININSNPHKYATHTLE